MSNYLIQGETLTAIADVIRAKTGGVDLMTPEAMAAAIAGISGSPEGIDKIDGGVFTMTSTHSSGDYEIEHNLGVYPDFFLITNVSTDAFSQPQNRNMKFYLVCVGRHLLNTTIYDGVYALTGANYSIASRIAVSSIGDYCDNRKLYVDWNYYATLVSGQTYAWVAFTFKR